MSTADTVPASLPARLFTLAVQSAGTGVFLLDTDLRITYANPAFERDSGYSREEAVGRPADFLLAKSPASDLAGGLQALLERGDHVRQVLLARRKDGTTFWVNLSLSPIREDGGRLGGYVGVAEDLSTMREAQAQMERVASTDGLTGLPNRRAFDSALAVEYARAVRHSYRLSVLFFDLVNFAAVNDLIGAEAADVVLRRVGAALALGGRASDQVFRIGPDEFALILPHAGGSQAMQVAQRASRVIQGIEVGGERLTVRVGSAVFPEDSRDARGLVAVASDRVRITTSASS
jgi:diguanylate cyclase (GGDEF)-like protein/PAS domain S-box-containing protein